ncbi:MAG: DUF456 domain-containing protein [Prevotellaceae bacterium]|jgi:uncharacterized protein YqgC (DUF456 family)|nr:DUF456 domain-containing protein [Prevotellaceae bacterium]
MIDILLLVAAILCLLIGFVGCLIPMLPGPPAAWVALPLLKFTHWGDGMLWPWIVVFAALALIVTVLDYWAPAWGVKKLGGTRAGTWGATAGLIVGLFFLPMGIILGPFLGALLGELLTGTPGKNSLKSALGAFIGFLFGTGLKFISCTWIAFYFILCLFLY